MIRIILVLLFELILSVFFAIVFAGAFLWFQGKTVAQAFTVDAPKLILTFMDIGIAAFAILLIIGGIRKRGLGWSIGGTIVAAILAAGVNLAWVAILASRTGVTDFAAVTLAIQAGVIFVIAAAIATISVRRVIPIQRRE